MIMNNIVKSYVRFDMYEFIYDFIIINFHAVEFIIMKSYQNSYYEFIYEFIAVNNIVKSWLNCCECIQIRNHG